MSFLKTLLLVVVLGAGFTLVPFTVHADKYGIDDAQKATGNLLPDSIAGVSGTDSDSVPKLIGKIIAIALSFLAVVFFLLIFYAGILWMTARGNSEAVTKAKDIMEAAVIGLLIVMASYAISQFVFNNLVGTTESGSSGAGSEDPAVVACRGGQVGSDCTLDGKKGFCDPDPSTKIFKCIPASN